MKRSVYRFSKSEVSYYFDGSIRGLAKLTDRDKTILLTDEHVFNNHSRAFKGWNTIVLKPGEDYKIQPTVDAVIAQLIEMEADRQSVLVGIGGGVITDLAGYVATVFMRGIRFGFVPTTLLAMVDAAIGGKNGIDVGPYKNMVGTIRQPSFLLYDFRFLESLPDAEWRNGFAEIIKHACIKDNAAFRLLEKTGFAMFRRNHELLAGLVERNARLKSSIVRRDEFEKGERKLLNFGHTLGHAIETQYELSHGEAVAIGMTYACHFSEQMLGFRERERVVNLIGGYGLPTYAAFDKKKVFNVLKMDKKRAGKEISYILLEKIGEGRIVPVAITSLEKMIDRC